MRSAADPTVGPAGPKSRTLNLTPWALVQVTFYSVAEMRQHRGPIARYSTAYELAGELALLKTPKLHLKGLVSR